MYLQSTFYINFEQMMLNKNTTTLIYSQFAYNHRCVVCRHNAISNHYVKSYRDLSWKTLFLDSLFVSFALSFLIQRKKIQKENRQFSLPELSKNREWSSFGPCSWWTKAIIRAFKLAYQLSKKNLVKRSTCYGCVPSKIKRAPDTSWRYNHIHSIYFPPHKMHVFIFHSIFFSVICNSCAWHRTEMIKRTSRLNGTWQSNELWKPLTLFLILIACCSRTFVTEAVRQGNIGELNHIYLISKI